MCYWCPDNQTDFRLGTWATQSMCHAMFCQYIEALIVVTADANCMHVWVGVGTINES